MGANGVTRLSILLLLMGLLLVEQSRVIYCHKFASVNDLPGYEKDVEGQDSFVEVEQGRLRGKRRFGDPDAGGTYNHALWFIGIPYAQPPIDELRFKKPVPSKPWEGVKDATKFGSVCPQVLSSLTYTRKQDEDCLTLNVFSPCQTDGRLSSKLPVMVYLHGGSNRVGAGSIFYGHLLAQRGVVVVSVNYRLGLLGYLCSNDDYFPGNYGLWDQIEALKWIQRNIEAFGGDPNKVTIFGNSAGGGNVGLLTLTPAAKGLFKYAIGQSGSPLAVWCYHRPETNLTEHLVNVASGYNCGASNKEEIYNCLRTKSFRTLRFPPLDIPRIMITGNDFKPCVDGDMFPKDPHLLLKEGNINAEIYMTGTTSHEWAFNMGWLMFELTETDDDIDLEFSDGLDRYTFERAVKHVVHKRMGWPESLGDLMVHQYTDWNKVDDPFENRERYVMFGTDMIFLAATMELVEELLEHKTPVYLYVFNHYSKLMEDPWEKAYHSSELNYIFGSPFTNLNVDLGKTQNYTEVDRRMSRETMLLWTNFAKYGNPTNSKELGKDQWTLCTPKSMDYLDIHVNGSHMKQKYRYDKMQLWNKVLPQLSGESFIEMQNSQPQPWYTLTWVLLILATIFGLLFILSFLAFIRIRRKGTMSMR